MKEKKAVNISDILIFIAVGIVLIILPLPRGTFFEKEIVPTELAVYSIFIFWSIVKLIKKEKLQVNSLLMVAVCILPIAYMLPTFLGYAANKSDAISYVMRYGAYLAAFIIASDMTKSKEQVRLWLYLIAASGVCVSLLGIDSLAGGAIGAKLGFESIGFKWNRLYGVFQYANTTGMYLGMMFFVLIGIILLSDKKYIKIISSSLMFLMLTGVLLTMSRGALLILPVIYLALLVLLKQKNQKIEMLLTTGVPGLLALLCYQPLQLASPVITEATGVASNVWLLVLAGMFISAIGSFVLLLLTNVLNKVSEKTYTILFISVIIIVIVAIGVLFFSGMYTKIIPQSILDRFMQKGEQATSGRTDFYRDGLRVLKDTWLLGAGGGAWNTLYRAYQSYDYGSSEAHNLLLQVWIETGLIGLLAYIAMLVGVVKTYIDSRKKATNSIVVLLGAVIFYVIGHSMVDFDFSYFSIPFVTFIILGALNAIGNIEDQKTVAINKLKLDKSHLNFKISAGFGTTIATVFAIFAICFIVARGYAVKATTILASGEITTDKVLEMEKNLRQATKLDPWNIKFYTMEKKLDVDMQMDLDGIYSMSEQIDPKNETAVKLHYTALTQAMKLSPKNPFINMKYGMFLIKSTNLWEEGLKHVDAALKYSPMVQTRYTEVANAYYAMAEYFVKQGQPDNAKKYYERILNLNQELDQANKKAIKPVAFDQDTLNYIEKAKQALAK
jgi:O-antigen ligase